MTQARQTVDPRPEVDWEEETKAILKSELKRRKLTYSDLAERFVLLGLPITEPTLRNKISRGSFSAVFFLQCLAALDCSTLHLRLPDTPAYVAVSPIKNRQ